MRNEEIANARIETMSDAEVAQFNADCAELNGEASKMRENDMHLYNLFILYDKWSAVHKECKARHDECPDDEENMDKWTDCMARWQEVDEEIKQRQRGDKRADEDRKVKTNMEAMVYVREQEKIRHASEANR